jgi:hypothetical protein
VTSELLANAFRYCQSSITMSQNESNPSSSMQQTIELFSQKSF